MQVGLAFFTGHKVPQNYSEAAKWYRKATETRAPRGTVLPGHALPRRDGRSTGGRCRPPPLMSSVDMICIATALPKELPNPTFGASVVQIIRLSDLHAGKIIGVEAIATWSSKESRKSWKTLCRSAKYWKLSTNYLWKNRKR